MTATVATHVYLDDGTRDHNDRGRCVDCGLPASNQAHRLPDTTTQDHEHRRRTGDRTDT